MLLKLQIKGIKIAILQEDVETTFKIIQNVADSHQIEQKAD